MRKISVLLHSLYVPVFRGISFSCRAIISIQNAWRYG
jgi:hypothetical protein